MTTRGTPVFRGVLVDACASMTLNEFSRACGVESEVVRQMVFEGVIETASGREEDWLFSHEALLRAKRAVRLVRDLRVNWPGAALALDLLEELERLSVRTRR